MKLGFYYHIPMLKVGSELRTASYLGLFLDALAEQVEELVCFMHECPELSLSEMDYCLVNSNITWVSLGPKKHILFRYFFQNQLIGKRRKLLRYCDAVLVRVPSPIFSAFVKFHPNVHYLVVGSYGSSIPFIKGNFLKSIILKWLVARIDRDLNIAYLNRPVIVNSTERYIELSGKLRRLSEIKTTTIRESDFYIKKILKGEKVKILYAGRIDFAKGIKELCLAMVLIFKEFSNVELCIVGWEDGKNQPVTNFIKEQFISAGFSELVTYFPRQVAGEQLNRFYKESDIYLIPSYHEGFPRTIWEAMAQSTLVIATSVGSIPYFLSDENAVLIPPHDSDALYKSIKQSIENPQIANERIIQAFMLVKEVTLESQTLKLVNIIENYS